MTPTEQAPIPEYDPALCPVERALEIVGDRWALLILRRALLRGTTRFADFRDGLGIAPNILTDRLAMLVEEGIMARRGYREPGSRERFEYLLTDAGREFNLLVSALGYWGTRHRPLAEGREVLAYRVGDSSGVELAYLTADGERVDPLEVSTVRREAANPSTDGGASLPAARAPRA
ncbi:winged helix-turn-helix transcriptional regulator [Mycetocola spongiae]|uniref:winged helix-turn-helix transcriptional regulator n=1 Tax=Mycetocola spongiae TaxID=2859226 RepID=UPI001CF134BA|nr:helix-turn-helix domain-containing protein [Mycetocola spongiae]UCR90119.1 helix-turn-helix transcriptional regulator [Mycetocola spongiae]